MRRKVRSGISILLALSMISFPCGGGTLSHTQTTVAAAATDDSSEVTDTETSYTYTVYDVSDESGETKQKANITGYVGSETDLTIPAKVGQYDVGSIGDEAFKENADITSVVISEGIDTIGYQAFYGCTSLESVTIPSTITTWTSSISTNYNNSAFYGCTGLTNLTLTEGLTILGQQAFYNCSSIESLTVPSTIKTFENSVFMMCTGLTDLTLKEGIEEIGYCAFCGCSSLEEVTIPSTVKRWALINSTGVMGQTHECYTFKNCSSLKRITFADGLKTLENFQGLSGCSLVTEIEIPSSVENLTYAFRSCSYLEKVTLNEGLETIGESAFYNCSSLKEIQIPDTVTSVGASAFYNCSALTSLTFPSAVTGFSGSITYGCSSLKSVYILADKVSNGYQKFTLPTSGKLYCIDGSDTYNVYQSGMTSDGTVKQLAVFPGVEVEAEGYQGVYDGTEYDAVTLGGTQEGDEILYRLDQEDEFSSEVPKIKEPGTYTVQIRIDRATESVPPFSVSILTAQAEIQKKSASIQLKDIQVNEGSAYTITPEVYEGEGDIVYTYYKDEALEEECEKPTEPGVYYVKGTVDETEHYIAGESNVAKITILKVSTSNITPAPGAPVKPSTKPSVSKKVTVKKVTLKKVKSKKKKTLLVQWKKISGVTGYEIWIGTNKKMTKGKKTYTVKKAKTIKKTIKKLKSKKKYYVKVRAYKKVNGKKHNGTFSAVKSVKIK